MPETASENVFPVAMGVEEETMLMTGSSMAKLRSASHFVLNFHDLMPTDLARTHGKRSFLQNGGLVYDGGQESLERVTPECATAQQAAEYIQANEDLLVDMAKNYIDISTQNKVPAVVRVHRRVADAHGNTKGMHDNFGLSGPLLSQIYDESKLRLLMAHLATRSFITGAGQMTPTGYLMAQKAGTVTSMSDYGFKSSVFRVANDDTGKRLEVRCGDINISPWATQVRLGSMSLLLASMQVPELAEEIRSFTPPLHDVQSVRLGLFRAYTQLRVNPDGSVRPLKRNLRALDYQQRLAELEAAKLGAYVSMPDDLQKIALEKVKYCEDYRKVLNNEAPITVLADRSDMAAKIGIILRDMSRDKSFGAPRELGDARSQAVDMSYDMIKVTANQDNEAAVSYGSGYKLRKKGVFKMALVKDDVRRAYYRAPTGTRAYFRGELIRNGLVKDCTWSDAILTEQDGCTVSFDLGDVSHGAKSSALDEHIDYIKATY